MRFLGGVRFGLVSSPPVWTAGVPGFSMALGADAGRIRGKPMCYLDYVVSWGCVELGLHVVSCVKSILGYSATALGTVQLSECLDLFHYESS